MPESKKFLNKTREELILELEELHKLNKKLNSSEKEYQQSSKLLADSEERLRILFESAPDAYYIIDLLGNFIDGNETAEKLMGYERDELIGKNFRKLKLLQTKDLPRAIKNLAKKRRRS